MSGIIKVRYNNFPINLLYNEGSWTLSPLVLINFVDCSMGMLEGLQASKLILDSSSRGQPFRSSSHFKAYKVFLRFQGPWAWIYCLGIV